MADTVSSSNAKALKRAHIKGRYSKDLFILQQLVGKDFKLQLPPQRPGRRLERAQPAADDGHHELRLHRTSSRRMATSGDYPLYLIVGNITFALMSDSTNQAA